MERCPNHEQLHQLLAETLPGEERTALEQHVEQCADCQQTLDRLTSDSLLVLNDPKAKAALVQLLAAGTGEGSTLPDRNLNLADPGRTSDENVVRHRSLPGDRSIPSLAPVGYEVLEELGRGSMGVVYKARQVQLNRLVALKTILAGTHADDASRSRFRIEAEAIASIQHPNVIQVHEIFEADGNLYLALEYCGGGSLQRSLAGNPLEAQPAAVLVETLALAMEDAHRQGVIHRDLKPANVLLAEDGTPKVTDFGLAKTGNEAGLTATGAIMGTPSYMAPEQASGANRDIGPATDVYALGAILYECLTGRPPFRAATVPDTITQVVHADPVSPRSLQPRTPRDLETICLKCLHKKPVGRYASARELAEDLRRYLEGVPILARPLGPIGKATRWARRRPAVASLIGAIAVCIVVGLALVGWQWHRANEERDKAEEKAQAESAAKAEAEGARKQGEERQAHLALARGLALCEQGEINQGLLWLGRALELAERAGATYLDRPIRINLADWASQLPRSLHQYQHPNGCYRMAFSPDGKLIASVGDDGRVHFWNVTTGKEDGASLYVYFPPLHHRIWDVAFSPDGKMIVTAGADGRGVLWDVATRKRVRNLQHRPDTGDANVWSAAFSPDGTLVVTAGTGGVARVWKTATGESVGEVSQFAGGDVRTIAFSPDGKTLYVSGDDHNVRRWKVASLEQINPPLNHRFSAVTLAPSSDGRSVLTGTEDGTLYFWDAESGNLQRTATQSLTISAVQFTPDGRLFVSSSRGIVRLWDTWHGQPIGPVIRQDADVSTLAFSPNGKLLAIGERNGTIRLWTMPELNSKAPVGRKTILKGFSFDRAGRLMLLGSPHNWSLHDATKEDLPQLTQSDPKEHGVDGHIECVALSPDGKTVAAGMTLTKVYLWDVATRKPLFRDLKHSDKVTQVAFSADGKQLLTYNNRTTSPFDVLRDRGASWDVPTGKRLRPLFGTVSPDVNQWAWNADKRLLLLGCRDKTARFHDVETNQPDGEPLPHVSSVTAVAFSANGRRFVTGCRDGTLHLWDTESRRPLQETMRHLHEVSAVAFSPDGSMILAGDREGLVRFWDVAAGQPLGAPVRHTGSVFCLAFHPDGKQVVTNGYDEWTRRWPVPAPPVAGTPGEVRQWIETLTHLRMDDADVIRASTAR